MKIVLLNLLDSMMSGAAAFIFFQTILGKKKSQLPYYIILLIFVCSFTIYAAITSILIGNTSTLAVYLRLTLSSLLCFCLSFLYSANLRTKILISISTTILCSIFEAFSYYIITSIYSYRVEKDTMDFLVFSNISLMANMFFLIFSILIHFIWKKEAFVHSLSYTIILLVIPVLSMCLLLSKPILYLNINIPSAFFILAAFVLFINIMNYILFYNVLENEELRFQLTIQKEQIEFQRNKYEQLGAAYKNIRSFMHDTKKHLFYIENCVTEKKYDDIIPYSKEIMHDLESRYCTINTGNLVIDAFVSNLLLQTKAQGITLHTNLKFDKATIPVNDYHLTIILGNLLDNALNACRGQIGANIKVAVRTVDGTFTIHVANTYVIADPDKAPDDFEKIDFIHGYGLKNVKDSAEACGGFCVINHENDIYSATVIIPVLNS